MRYPVINVKKAASSNTILIVNIQQDGTPEVCWNFTAIRAAHFEPEIELYLRKILDDVKTSLDRLLTDQQLGRNNDTSKRSTEG